MKTLQKLVENKTVAVVGRGLYLADIEQGEFIDSFDIVVRSHLASPHPARHIEVEEESDSLVPKIWQRRLGRKTDVLAPDIRTFSHGTIRRVIGHFKKTGGKMCVLDRFFHIKDSIRQIDIIEDEFMPVHVAMKDNYIALSQLIDYAEPLAGTLLIYEILQCKPKTLYHTGFACFQDEKAQLAKYAQASLVNHHHPLLDLRYLRQLTTHNEHITTDDFMLKLFEKERNLE